MPLALPTAMMIGGRPAPSPSLSKPDGRPKRDRTIPFISAEEGRTLPRLVLSRSSKSSTCREILPYNVQLSPRPVKCGIFCVVLFPGVRPLLTKLVIYVSHTKLCVRRLRLGYTVTNPGNLLPSGRTFVMPPLKPKPSEIAAEAKRTYIPYIEQHYPQYPAKSFLHPDSSLIRVPPGKSSPPRKLRVAVINGDPIDVALDWYEYDRNTRAEGVSSRHEQPVMPIPVVNMANEKRPGGDWESGVLAPEENMCRRSNLVHCLNTTWTASAGNSNYPIPTTGGIYSPYVGECDMKLCDQ